MSHLRESAREALPCAQELHFSFRCSFGPENVLFWHDLEQFSICLSLAKGLLDSFVVRLTSLACNEEDTILALN